MSEPEAPAPPTPTAAGVSETPAVSRADFESMHRVVAWLVLAVAVLVGLGLRATEVRGSLVGRHDFRQTQTAFTAKVFARDGVSLLHTPLPLFGPPWDVPFEMPLFQACAVGVMRVTGLDADNACRLTHLLWFVASAGALFALAAVLFDAPAAALATSIYLTSPLTFYWSVSGLMEFMAVFFALSYAAAFVFWLRRPRRAWAWPVAVAAGCVGALVKITTMAISVPVVLLAYAIYACAKPNRAGWRVHALALAAMAIPVAVGQAWVMHADAIKAASPLTLWLTSAALKEWNYGTLAQRLSLNAWSDILGRTVSFVVPCGVGVLAMAAVLPLGQHRHRRLFGAALLLGAALPVLVFFNLYFVHDYYQCAIVPMLTLAAGVGASAVARRFRRAGLAVVLLVLVVSQWYGHGYVIPSKEQVPGRNLKSATGLFVNSITSPEDYVIVRMGTWDPTLLYYAERQGLMWSVPERPSPYTYDEATLLAMLQKMGLSRITTIVTTDPDDPLLRLWRHVTPQRVIGPLHIAKVADPVTP